MKAKPSMPWKETEMFPLKWRLRQATLLAALFCVSPWLPATETENYNIRALPAPEAIDIDGDACDWDLSGGVFVCADVENQREAYAVWMHVMYDAENLYLLARWRDPTPLNNPGQVEGSHGFNGDCLQFRIITAEGKKDQERVSHWTCWMDHKGDHVMNVCYGRKFNEGGDNDIQRSGGKQAFKKAEDGAGYTQELAIPWRVLTQGDGTLEAGETFALTVEPNFSVGAARLSTKGIFRTNVAVNRVFTFMNPACWGEAQLLTRNNVPPQPVRLTDAREFKVAMVDGRPKVDWTGLVREEAVKGFKEISFTMPFDGYVSMQIRDAQGRVVRQLLNAAFRTAGTHETLWDGLTTFYYKETGTPVAAGTYTVHAIAHQGAGLRLRGWACNAGTEPYDNGPASNWGGDHGYPSDVATQGKMVFLGWSGAEAGKAVVAMDNQGNVKWKNNRGGMGGAPLLAVDGKLLYVVNGGNRALYRLNVNNGSYAVWKAVDSPDLVLREVFEEPALHPGRIEGLAAHKGRLYISAGNIAFRREQITKWRPICEKIYKAETGIAGRVWKALASRSHGWGGGGSQYRITQWMEGHAKTEEDALRSPNYFTPDARDAMVRVFNSLLRAPDLGEASKGLAGNALVLANRRILEAWLGDATLVTREGSVLVVDAADRKLLKTCSIPFPRRLHAVSEELVYVISDGRDLMALNPVSGESRLVLTGREGLTAVATDEAGSLYVAIQGKTQQIEVYSPEGELLRTIGRKGGRQVLGSWQQDGLYNPAGLAVDATGQVWASEYTGTPKRFSLWDGKTGALEREFFGPTHYGASGGAILPADPNVMVGDGCEWRLDPKTGRDTLVGVFDTHYHSYARFAQGTNGRTYLAVAAKGSGVIIFERLGPGQYARRTAITTKTIADPQNPHHDRRSMVFWADQNGDGTEQQGEVTEFDRLLSFSGYGGWSLYMDDALNLRPVMGARRDKALYLPVTGFTPAGAPLYTPETAEEFPVGGLESIDGARVVSIRPEGRQHWVMGHDSKTGESMWRYASPFFGVHGSHTAPAPQVGLLRGVFGPVGRAHLTDEIGSLYAFNSNVGEWHVLTQDGFYVTRLFQGNAMLVQWPEKPKPGAIMDNCPPGLGGEDFGGSLTQGEDGKVYIQAGKTALWNLAVVGLDTVQRLDLDQTIAITEADTKRAAAMQAEYAQEAAGTKRFIIDSLGDDAKPFSGQGPFASFQRSGVGGRVAARWDAEHLYVTWFINDRTPWQNKATAVEEMYIHGDTVDLQLAADPKANAKRAEPGPGDLRLSIGNFRGKPTAVLYRKVASEKKPFTFSSGVVAEYIMDYVSVEPSVKVQASPHGHAYTVHATIPWAVLGITPKAGLELQGDFGATFGGAGGGRTRLRVHWNNQHTGIVDDAVFELKMQPNYWGRMVLR